MAMETVPPTARCLFPGKEHRNAITVPEFKLWLKQFDTDRRISRKELREAIRRRSTWLFGLRAWFAMRHADRNRIDVSTYYSHLKTCLNLYQFDTILQLCQKNMFTWIQTNV